MKFPNLAFSPSPNSSVGIFVSEPSLFLLAAKLGISDEISVQLQSAQSEGDVKIVEKDREMEEVQLENNLFRKLMNFLNRMISFFNMDG